MWLKRGRSVFWVVSGILSLELFAVLLARTETALAGRAFAAYGGVYIAASLVWLALEERTMPGPWDVAGAVLCIAGACIIVAGPKFS
jgi:small multidrug resistance family-3 protein